MGQNNGQASEQPSLYHRLGGLYKIATLDDDLIDWVMVDPRLNANPPCVDEATTASRWPGSSISRDRVGLLSRCQPVDLFRASDPQAEQEELKAIILMWLQEGLPPRPGKRGVIGRVAPRPE
jgi:hypothetical protein